MNLKVIIGLIGAIYVFRMLNNKKKSNYLGGGGGYGTSSSSSSSSSKMSVVSRSRIDLTNVNLISYKNEIPYNNEIKDSSGSIYMPVYNTINEAAKNTDSNSAHLVVPGLSPAPPIRWSGLQNNNRILYMPNDKKPHKHGQAVHHKFDGGFKINEVFLLSKNNFVKTENKKLEKYRNVNGIKKFNNGEPNTPIETWIEWKIPSDNKEYPILTVRKDSILWWDISKNHNLEIVNEKDYQDNKDSNNIISPESKVVVTIMDKIGTFYFLCSVGTHAARGHKIQINVVDNLNVVDN